MENVESVKLVRKKKISTDVSMTSEPDVSINDKDIMDEPTTPVSSSDIPKMSENYDNNPSFRENEDEEEKLIDKSFNNPNEPDVLTLNTSVQNNYRVSVEDISDQHLNLFSRRNGLTVEGPDSLLIEKRKKEQEHRAKLLSEGRTHWSSKLWLRLLWLPTITFNYLQSSFSPQSFSWSSRIDDHIVLGAFPVGFNHSFFIRHFKITHVISLVEDWELSLGRGIFTGDSPYRRPIKQLHVPVQDHWGTLDLDTIDKILNFINLAIHGEVEVHKSILESKSSTDLLTTNYNQNSKSSTSLNNELDPKYDDDSLSFISNDNDNDADVEVEAELNPQSFVHDRSWIGGDKSVVKKQKSTVVKVIEKLNTNNNSNLKNAIYIHCKSGRGRSAMIVACFLIKKYNWTAEEAVIFLKSKRPAVNINGVKWKTVKKFEKANRITDLKKLLKIHNIQNESPSIVDPNSGSSTS